MAALNDHSLDKCSSLSAMFDGEATQKDVEYLLNADGGELSRQLESFHLIQQTLHKDSKVAVGLEDSLVLGIRAKIEAEDLANESVSADNKLIPFVFPSEKGNVKASRPAWKVMFSSVAVAASVTFLVILGGNVVLTPDAASLNVIADVQSPATNNAVISLADLKKDRPQVDNVRLQNYLRQHAEQASMTVGQGMIPMARVVSYPVKE
jgi:sigma-E factor negative regulatory protein RseA